MKMVRQHAYRDGLEREPFLDHFVGMPQTIDLSYQQVARAIGKCNREKECAALDLGASIARH
jgi:hypothetical protein